LLRKSTVLLLSFVSILSVLSFHNGLATTQPAQYGQVDIWTDHGGQGFEQYGGAYSIGDSITLYIQSSFDGEAIVAVCYGGMNNCNEITEMQVVAYQTYTLGPNTVGSPSGQHYFVLQVCPSVGPPITTTPSLPPTSIPQNPKPEQSNCPEDYTWIDVSGATTSLSTTTSSRTTTTLSSTTVTQTIFQTKTTSCNISIMGIILGAVVGSGFVALATAIYVIGKNGMIRRLQDSLKHCEESTRNQRPPPGDSLNFQVRTGTKRLGDAD
jgi:hypothetical protein